MTFYIVSGACPFNDLLVWRLVDASALHYEDYVLQDTDVLEWIAFYCNDISEVARDY